MKKILIIAPHFPPSNLAAVHRSRLFAQHLPSFGWDPTILMVHENFYEEKLDWNLAKLLPPDLKIEKSDAYKITRPRLIGDIGLRSLRQIIDKGEKLIKKEKFDFLYIPIPSFYTALAGRALHKRTGIRYGIDYIDPWVHKFPGQEKLFSRHWWSSKLAKLLEPIAIKNASVITGVAEGYYKGVQERNPHLLSSCVFAAMPYGGEALDHKKVDGLDIAPYLFNKNGKLQLVYAGAMLPRAYEPLKRILKTISNNKALFDHLEIHFIGTGKSPNDTNGYNIKPIAESFGLWQTVIFEYPARIPYLDVLVHLKAADGVFILGSTEPHYTPSKIYQGILSEKLLLAILHAQSSAVGIIKRSNAGCVLAFEGEEDVQKIEVNFVDTWKAYKERLKTFMPADVRYDEFAGYSAYEVTKQLAAVLDKAVK